MLFTTVDYSYDSTIDALDDAATRLLLKPPLYGRQLGMPYVHFCLFSQILLLNEYQRGASVS